MPEGKKVRVEANGYGVIGKRVTGRRCAAAGHCCSRGVSDVATDWRAHMVTRNGFRLFGATDEPAHSMRETGPEVIGVLDDLPGQIDVIVDCTPKRVAAKNVDMYCRRGLKLILQGGEKQPATGHSFVAESSIQARSEIPSRQGPDAQSVDPEVDSFRRPISAS